MQIPTMRFYSFLLIWSCLICGCSQPQKTVEIDTCFLKELKANPSHKELIDHYSEIQYLVAIDYKEAIDAALSCLQTTWDDCSCCDDRSYWMNPMAESDHFWPLVSQRSAKEQLKIIRFYDTSLPIDWKSERDRFLSENPELAEIYEK